MKPVIDRATVLSTVQDVLAAECWCESSTFNRDETLITRSNGTTVAGRYFHPSDPFIVTMGRGVVLAASSEHIDWVRSQYSAMDREAVFSARSIGMLSGYLSAYNKIAYGPDLKYICAPADLIDPPERFRDSIVIHAGEEVFGLYEHPGFANALQYDCDHPQPDVLAAVFYVDGNPVGVAGASADSDQLWQIGIDVLPDHRACGVGRALVWNLTRAIHEHDKVPYYSTSPSNIGSRRLARSVGFWPAWTEIRTWADAGHQQPERH